MELSGIKSMFVQLQHGELKVNVITFRGLYIKGTMQKLVMYVTYVHHTEHTGPNSMFVHIQ